MNDDSDYETASTMASGLNLRKTFQDIAFGCGDFASECGAGDLNPELNGILKKKMYENITPSIQNDLEKLFGDASAENPTDILNEIFDFHEQGFAMSVNTELDGIALAEESRILGQSIRRLKVLLGESEEESSVDLKMIQMDFNKSKKLLNDTISTVFKERSDEILFLLSDLLKEDVGAGQQKDYLNLSTEQYADDIVNSLVDMGVIEFHPEDDTLIKLAPLNC